MNTGGRNDLDLPQWVKIIAGPGGLTSRKQFVLQSLEKFPPLLWHPAVYPVQRHTSFSDLGEEKQAQT